MKTKTLAAFALILTLYIFAQTQTTTKSATAKRAQTWEYNVVITSVETGAKDLSHLGAEGWELVSTDETVITDKVYYVAFLKRAK